MSLEADERLFSMPFSRIYDLYIKKAQRKGRKKSEVDFLIYRLTGYDEEGICAQINKKSDMRAFFDEAPQFNSKADGIKGVICNVRIETIDNPLMRKIRQLDKLIDDLAKGKGLDKILEALD